MLMKIVNILVIAGVLVSSTVLGQTGQPQKQSTYASELASLDNKMHAEYQANFPLINSKIPLSVKQITIEQLANINKPNVQEKTQLGNYLKLRNEYFEKRINLIKKYISNPSFVAEIIAAREMQNNKYNQSLADLYVGKISYGEFNKSSQDISANAQLIEAPIIAKYRTVVNQPSAAPSITNNPVSQSDRDAQRRIEASIESQKLQQIQQEVAREAQRQATVRDAQRQQQIQQEAAKEAKLASTCNELKAQLAKLKSDQNGFFSGWADAAAWTSGGTNGPTAALNARESQKMAQRNEINQMQLQIINLCGSL
jgi:hypothetical protein